MNLQLILSAFVGMLFLLQVLYFCDIGQQCRIGLKFKRMGSIRMSAIANPRKSYMPFLFALLSATTGFLIVLFSPHWVLTILIGGYALILIDQAYEKKNYLTFKSGVQQYCLMVLFWILYDRYDRCLI